MDLTSAVKQYARQLGFLLVGVTTGAPLPHEDVFLSWLQHGRQGEMGYLASAHSQQCRANPQKILSECRSVLVLGVRYPAPIPAAVNAEQRPMPRGRVAAYAWGTDYHEFLPLRLQSLVQFIESHVGHPIPNRWYTDTGPILERELAMRAGLGWIGKNTCLINPLQGSYFLLAEILLGIELAPYPPFTADRCGTCTRCLQACPTGCIQPDRTLDARRCISYLTIELKAAIPRELRSLMGSWVFGCDVCQQVCPWNHFASSAVDRAFELSLVLPEPELLSELALSAQEFNRKYRHSPLRRAKHRGYLRNISVALGNQHQPEVVSSLGKVMQSHSEPLVRAHAAWALGQIGTPLAIKKLQHHVGQEIDLQVLDEVKAALSRFP
jgi:epoxyqueuosine reductase